MESHANGLITNGLIDSTYQRGYDVILCKLNLNTAPLTHKQRFLTPGHQGWNDLHSLCHIGMEYYLLKNDDNNDDDDKDDDDDNRNNNNNDNDYNHNNDTNNDNNENDNDKNSSDSKLVTV